MSHITWQNRVAHQSSDHIPVLPGLGAIIAGRIEGTLGSVETVTG